MNNSDSKSEADNNQEILLNEGSLVGMFDFKRARYTTTKKRMGIKAHLFYLLCFIFGTLGLIGCVIFLKYSQGYSLFLDVFPSEISYLREVIRWTMYYSLGMLAYGFFFSVSHLLPIMFSRYYRSRGREVPEKMAKSLVFFINISERLSLLLTVIAMYIISFYLFPSPAAFPSAPLSGGDGEGEEEKDKESTFRQLFQAFQNKSLQETYAQHPWQIILNRLLLALTISFFLFFLERILIVRLAIHFHQRTLQAEIESNSKALETIKLLRRKVIGTQKHIKHEELGGMLYDRLCQPDAESIRPADLSPFMTESESQYFFTLIDLDENGDLTREEFVIAVSNFYRQREALRKSIYDDNQILDGLDSILKKIITVACVVVSFALLDPQLSTQITTIGTTLVSATILFHGTAAIAFQSIVFITITHPFDVGDKVIIGEDTLVVQQVGLWACSFSSVEDGKTVYMTNHSMRNKYIANLKRSPPMDEDFVIRVSPETSQEKLNELERTLKDYVQENKRDYAAAYLKNVKIMDKDRLEVVIGVNHRSNFQNVELKSKRTKNFMFQLRESLDRLAIPVAPAIH